MSAQIAERAAMRLAALQVAAASLPNGGDEKYILDRARTYVDWIAGESDPGSRRNELLNQAMVVEHVTELLEGMLSANRDRRMQAGAEAQEWLNARRQRDATPGDTTS